MVLLGEMEYGLMTYALQPDVDATGNSLRHTDGESSGQPCDPSRY